MPSDCMFSYLILPHVLSVLIDLRVLFLFSSSLSYFHPSLFSFHSLFSPLSSTLLDLCPMDKGIKRPRREAYLHLVPRLRMHVSVPPRQHSGNFALVTGSHVDECEDDRFLGQSVLSRWSRPTFQRCLLRRLSGWWWMQSTSTTLDSAVSENAVILTLFSVVVRTSVSSRSGPVWASNERPWMTSFSPHSANRG
jgi:hypothetical protein